MADISKGSIGPALEKARKHSDISLPDLATLTGYTERFLNDVFSGSAIPTERFVRLVAQHFGSRTLETMSILLRSYRFLGQGEVSQKLVRFVQDQGHTLKEIARILGCTEMYAFRLRNGTRGLSKLQSAHLSAAIGVALKHLVPIREEHVQVHVLVEDVWAELVSYLNKHPEYMYKMSPRKFEELVAELLRDMGYGVRLPPETRDRGRDILARIESPLGEILTIVECKRYAPERTVGINIVERFLWTIEQKDKASCGVIATTSFFTAGAKALEDEYRWKLKLRDYSHLREWIGKYGTWKQQKESHLWTPDWVSNVGSH